MMDVNVIEENLIFDQESETDYDLTNYTQYYNISEILDIGESGIMVPPYIYFATGAVILMFVVMVTMIALLLRIDLSRRLAECKRKDKLIIRNSVPPYLDFSYSSTISHRNQGYSSRPRFSASEETRSFHGSYYLRTSPPRTNAADGRRTSRISPQLQPHLQRRVSSMYNEPQDRRLSMIYSPNYEDPVDVYTPPKAINADPRVLFDGMTIERKNIRLPSESSQVLKLNSQHLARVRNSLIPHYGNEGINLATVSRSRLHRPQGRHDPHLGIHPGRLQTSRGQVRSMYVYDWILDTTKKDPEVRRLCREDATSEGKKCATFSVAPRRKIRSESFDLSDDAELSSSDLPFKPITDGHCLPDLFQPIAAEHSQTEMFQPTGDAHGQTEMFQPIGAEHGQTEMFQPIADHQSLPEPFKPIQDGLSDIQNASRYSNQLEENRRMSNDDSTRFEDYNIHSNFQPLDYKHMDNQENDNGHTKIASLYSQPNLVQTNIRKNTINRTPVQHGIQTGLKEFKRRSIPVIYRGKSFDALTDSIQLQPLTEDNVASLSMDQWPRSVASQTVNSCWPQYKKNQRPVSLYTHIDQFTTNDVILDECSSQFIDSGVTKCRGAVSTDSGLILDNGTSVGEFECPADNQDDDSPGCEYIENTDPPPDVYNEGVHGEVAGDNTDHAYDILYDSPVIVSNKIYQG